MNVWISVSLMLNRLLVVSKDCRDPQTVGKPKLTTSILQNYSHLPVSFFFLCKTNKSHNEPSYQRKLTISSCH